DHRKPAFAEVRADDPAALRVRGDANRDRTRGDFGFNLERCGIETVDLARLIGSDPQRRAVGGESNALGLAAQDLAPGLAAVGEVVAHDRPGRDYRAPGERPRL